jgi:predicted nucleic acid-binding protein
MQLETKISPRAPKKFDELVRPLEVVDVSDEEMKKYTTIVADLNDRHVLAGAEAGCADYLVTLDWKHFLSSSAKKTVGGLSNSAGLPRDIGQSLS